MPPSQASGERLRKGEGITEGGYLKKGVWGSLEGVVDVPPVYVWRLFLQANDWRRYGLPQLMDSRSVSDDLAGQTVSFRKVEQVYTLLGNQVFDPLQNQKSKSSWSNHVFQYYDVPWPVSNRWMVLRNTFDETKSDEAFYRCEWEKVAGNVATLAGHMTLEPFEGNPNRTLMKYYVASDPGASVPKFLLKWGVKHSLPGALQAIRREALRVYRKPLPLVKTPAAVE